MPTRLFDDLAAWWHTVPPEWVFLFLLPFAVAACGLAADGWRAGDSGPRDR